MIYLDNNATTRVAPEVVEALLPFLGERYGNPSSLHALGEDAARAVASARASVARLIGASSPREIVFTSGGTESDQTALRALARASSGRRRILTTAVEHSAVLEPLAELERQGYLVERVGVDASGALDAGALSARLGPDVALVSVMWANNETGAVHDVEAIGRACRALEIPFHVDAVQACGKLPMRVESLPIDVASFSAHKLHGPKGVGALYVRGAIEIEPLIRGGPQESERRGGTENVPAIAGFGRAADLARAWLASGGPAILAARRDRLERGLLERVAGSRVHAGAVPRVANTSNLGFEGISGEALVALLAEQGVCASTGAACSSSRHRPSHVLIAMGLEPAAASESLRLSLSRFTTDGEVDAALEIVPREVARLRALAGTAAP